MVELEDPWWQIELDRHLVRLPGRSDCRRGAPSRRAIGFWTLGVTAVTGQIGEAAVEGREEGPQTVESLSVEVGEQLVPRLSCEIQQEFVLLIQEVLSALHRQLIYKIKFYSNVKKF